MTTTIEADRNTAPPPTGAERRRSPRVELKILIQYRFASYEAFLADTSLDISTGGIFICTDEPRANGELVYLQFRLSEGTPLIEGLGRVVHVNPPGIPDRVSGIGIEFVNLDETSRGIIASVVAHRMALAKENRGTTRGD
ncbi:MAG: PilZ domain-containing protein [Myxococcales bacterium]|jgi:uncharacterized protein (TIGR02266 family)|nr:PilZ domain-containing protein [Myxococcales bacterium]